MEYTQWEQNWKVLAQEYPVLILVVMEYTQWEYPINNNKLWKYGLNPCCNGIYSMRNLTLPFDNVLYSLNPCCNGIYSMSNDNIKSLLDINSLNPCCNGIYSMSTRRNISSY